jgi:hypothetical protein
MSATSWTKRASDAAGRARARLAAVDPRVFRGLAPAILPLAATPFLLASTRGELKEPVFTDALVFQYVGWCLRRGLRLYRDIGMADGPFIYYLHAAIQVFVGIGDRAFRKADLVLQLAGSGVMGAAVAPAAHSARWARRLDRAVWATVAMAIWLAWYFTFGWDCTGQREAFYGLFGSVGMALLFAAGSGSERRARVCTVVGAALVMSQAFGKPTGVMYPGAGLLCVALPNPASALDLGARLRAFFTGCVACVLAVVLALLVSGSIAGYFHFCWRIPIVGNRFLYRQNWLSYLLSAYWERFARVVAVALVGGVAAIATGLVPLRALGIVLLPAVAFLGACLQARGYDYHVMPAIAGAHLLLVVVLANLWKEEDAGWTLGRGSVAAAGLVFAGLHTFDNLADSHFRWSGDSATWDKPEHAHQDLEKEVGRYIGAHTKPGDWVFSYDANAHIVLLYAERRTASPYLHQYFLDQVGILPQSSVQPSPSELAALTRLQTDDRKAACDGVVEHQPAALALSSVDTSIAICPALRGMIDHDFDLRTTMGAYKIYLRKGR